MDENATENKFLYAKKNEFSKSSFIYRKKKNYPLSFLFSET